jgi:hypothetical protein
MAVRCDNNGVAMAAVSGWGLVQGFFIEISMKGDTGGRNRTISDTFLLPCACSGTLLQAESTITDLCRLYKCLVMGAKKKWKVERPLVEILLPVLLEMQSELLWLLEVLNPIPGRLTPAITAECRAI